VNESAIQRAMEIKSRYEVSLLKKANVVAVGVGFRQQGGETTYEVALVVSVTRKLPPAQLSPQDVIPDKIEGVPVDVRETGTIRAL
jgi:hypothetical protein